MTTITNTIDAYRPGERPDDTYASTKVSVDTKLAYNHDKDQWEAFILGDINANAEGTKMYSDGMDALHIDGVGELDDGRWLKDVVAEGYLHNARQLNGDGDVDIGVWMHAATYPDKWDDKDNWLVADKNIEFEAIKDQEGVDSVYPIVPGDGMLTVDDGTLKYGDEPIDGYANLYDQGDALLYALDGDVYAQAKGANAATASWTADERVRPWTDKSGPVEVATELADGYDAVRVADYERIESIDDILDFAGDTPGEDVIVKAVLSTWGDGVVAIDGDADYDAVETTIRNEESRVRSTGNRPDAFRIIDDEGYFVETSVGDAAANETGFDERTHGMVEEAIANPEDGQYFVHGDTGDAYTVFEYEGQPVDFVPFTTYDPATGEPEVYAVNVRTAGNTNLNANRGGTNSALQLLDEAFHDGVVSASFKDINIDYDLQDELEDLAGQDVAYEEIREPLEQAGEVAFGARNIAAFNAEQALQDGGAAYADHGDR